MLTSIACGAVFFPGLYAICRKWLKSTFSKWNDADVVIVSERLLSLVHATIASTAGIIVVTSCHNVMTDRHWLANDFVCFGAPYMAYDLYAMYLSHWHSLRVRGQEVRGHSLHTVWSFLLRDRLMVLHHLALLFVFLPVTLFLRRGLGDFFVGCLLTTELSTPFVSLGKILIQLGLQDGHLHQANGMLVLLSFLCCRILLFPYMYLAYGRQHGLPLLSVPLHLPLHCNIGNLAILAPQIYWFYLLCRKARRLYLRQTKPSDPSDLTHRSTTQ
ncbi:TLC domain-containing protein 3A-like [Osmerus eperlanus]|uniref:TLC domain-containing protein 3A-like n=1 Tax=Osmerus eperlanus TaxID=29151 RepID=UPI002E1465D0